MKRRIAARTTAGRGVWHLWTPTVLHSGDVMWDAACGTKRTSCRDEDDLHDIRSMWRTDATLRPWCARCRAKEPGFARAAYERRQAERKARTQQTDPYRRAAESVIACCCAALRSMPDFAGRDETHPFGSMEGVLREDAIEALLALDLDAVAEIARQAVEA